MAVVMSFDQEIKGWKLRQLRDALTDLARKLKDQRNDPILTREFRELREELLRRRGLVRGRDETTFLTTFRIEREAKDILGEEDFDRLTKPQHSKPQPARKGAR